QRGNGGLPQPVSSRKFFVPRRRARQLVRAKGDPSEEAETG
ncbi:hypothetical protein A2U01_0089774, partial [Trifolium medium]|nr:hypothetical protein [Trifolium medium]